MLMKKKLFILIIILIAGAAAWFYFNTEKTDSSKITLYGNVDIRQFDAAFQVSGQITKMYFEEGDTVKEGSLLAEIDAADYELQVAQSRSQTAEAYAALLQARSVYEKYSSLYRGGAISKLEFETAENDFKQADSFYNAAIASEQLTLRQNDYSKLYAMQDAVVTARLVEPGSVVEKGRAVYTFSKPAPIWVRAYISEVNLGNIYEGMPARIITDSVDPQTGARKTYAGHIGYISPVSEFTPKTVETTDLRTDLVYMLRIYADNPDKFLCQGMPATVIIDLTNKQGN